MTGEETAFVELQGIPPCPVKMPNGEYVMAIGEGTVLVGKLFLKGVLYVPEMRCNLIFVSKLARDKVYILKFTDRLCVVQDRTSRMLIGLGEELEGLYVARGEPLVNAHGAATVKNMDLWHKRLGHPSVRVIEKLPTIDGNIEINKGGHEPCDVCFRAKQTRIPFLTSDRKASDISELIHCDLWGAY